MIRIKDDAVKFIGGNTNDILKRRDTHILRHAEVGLFVWKWVCDKICTVKIITVIHPVLRAGRDALRVYRSEVNRSVYRKSHYDKPWHNNGASRHRPFADLSNQGVLGRCLKNYCVDCVEQIGREVRKGCYLPVEHECPRTRVYDRNGKLLEVV